MTVFSVTRMSFRIWPSILDRINPAMTAVKTIRIEDEIQRRVKEEIAKKTIRPKRRKGMRIFNNYGMTCRKN